MDLADKKVMSKINYKKALLFDIKKSYKENNIKGEVEKFTGYQNIGFFKISDLQKFNLSIEIQEGQACLIAIQRKDMKVITEKSMNGHIHLPFTKGYTRFRLIGIQTSLKFEITKLS